MSHKHPSFQLPISVQVVEDKGEYFWLKRRWYGLPVGRCSLDYTVVRGRLWPDDGPLSTNVIWKDSTFSVTKQECLYLCVKPTYSWNWQLSWKRLWWEGLWNSRSRYHMVSLLEYYPMYIMSFPTHCHLKTSALTDRERYTVVVGLLSTDLPYHFTWRLRC